MSENVNQRLGDFVRQRRKVLGLTQEDIAARGGPSSATVRLLERGQEVNWQRGTTAGLEKALEWAPGSIANVLSGGEPYDVVNPSPGDFAETVIPADDDVAVLGSLPPDALEGLSPADRAEVIAAAKLSALQTAREIRRRLDS